MENKIPAQKEQTKLWNRNYILILLMSTCNQSVSQMVTPFISKYAISLGAPMTIAATISALMSYAALCLRPVSGMFSDTFNRKRIITITSLITAACMVLYSVANSVTMLITVRLVHGIVFSFSGVAMMAFNTSFMPRERLAEGMGWMSLGSIVSSAIGPNLGLWLVDNVGYNACFLCAAVACVLTTTIILIIPYKHVPKPKNERRKFDINNLISLRLLPFAILTGLFSMGNGLVNTFLAMMGDERGIANVGLFFTTYSIVMVCCRPFVGKLQDRKGLKIILYPAYLIAACSMLILGHANALWMIILAGALKAIGQGCGAPSIQAHCMKQMGRDKAGIVSSTTYIGQDIGNAIAPTLGGIIQTNYGYTAVFTSYAATLLIVGWTLFTIKSKYDAKKYPDTNL